MRTFYELIHFRDRARFTERYPFHNGRFGVARTLVRNKARDLARQEGVEGVTIHRVTKEYVSFLGPNA